MGGLRKVSTRERLEAERMMSRVETELARRVKPGENDGGLESEKHHGEMTELVDTCHFP
jgi:hypothetical protein